jgi:hypothetical protein
VIDRRSGFFTEGHGRPARVFKERGHLAHLFTQGRATRPRGADFSLKKDFKPRMDAKRKRDCGSRIEEEAAFLMAGTFVPKVRAIDRCFFLLAGAKYSSYAKESALRAASPYRSGLLWNALAALAAIFQNREADLAWPERSIGTKVPAIEVAGKLARRLVKFRDRPP